MPKVNWAEVSRPSTRQKGKQSQQKRDNVSQDETDFIDDEVGLDFEEQLSLEQMRNRIAAKSRRRGDE